MNTQSTTLSGACQCGHVRYRLLSDPLTFYICHCRHCQQQSSSAFGMSLWIGRDQIEFTHGEPKLWITHGDSGAEKICAYCDRCGSRIYHAFGASDTLSLKAGLINEISTLEPIAHIWTKRTLPWVFIDREKYRCYDDEADDEELLALWASKNA